MLTLGSKTFVVTSLVAFAAAVGYGATTSDGAGTVLLILSVLGAAMLAYAVLTGAGASDGYSYEGGEDVRPARAPSPSIVPCVVALGAGVVGLGFALGAAGFVVGGLAIGVGLVLWFAQAWRDHPDYVAQLSKRVSDEVGLPFGMPLVVLGIIATIGIAISRTLVAVSPTASWIIALAVGATFFLSALVVAQASLLSKRALTVVILAAVVVIGGLGLYGLIRGERPFEHHEQHAGVVHATS